MPSIVPGLALLPLLLAIAPQQTSGRELLTRAVELHQAGRAPEAVEAYERAVAKLDAEGDREASAQALNNSSILRIESGDAAGGLKDAERALELNRALLERAAGDAAALALRARIARNLSNVGLALENLGETDRALAAYEDALAAQRALSDVRGSVLTLLNVCSLRWRRGDYDEALSRHRDAVALMDGAGAADWVPAQRRVADINLGSIREKLGQYREALEIYDRLLALERGALGDYHEAYVRLNRGPLLRHLGAPELARESYAGAKALFEKIGDGAGVANANLNLGILELENFFRPAAAEALFRSVITAPTGQELDVYAGAYLGSALLSLGRLEEALATLEATREKARERRFAEGEWIALNALARVVSARGEKDRALALSKEAIAIVEKLRSAIGGGEDRLGFLFDRSEPYAAALEILMSRGGSGAAEEALEIAERERARTFLDRIGSGPAESRPIAAADLASRMGAANAALVEYHYTRGAQLALVASGKGVELVPLDAAGDDVEAAIGRVSDALRSESGGEPAAEDLALLSHALVAPVLASLSPLPESLVVVADGPVAAVPLEILPFDATRPGSSLLERFRVAYAPSASTLRIFDAEAPAAPPLLGFGDPRAGSTGPDDRPLPALPFSRGELESTARLLGLGGERIFLGRENTLENFEREAARGARVLHLATHAIVDEFRSGASGLVFTPGPGGRGFLRADAIAAGRFASDLTILAACRSQRGPDLPGEGILGLARAFLLAGSRSVVASLWDVDDAVAAALVEQFAYELSRGETKAEALRLARLALRDSETMGRTRHWAAFTLWGDGAGRLTGDAGGRFELILGVAGAAALFAVALLLARPRG